jgi:hypothetical protein
MVVVPEFAIDLSTTIGLLAAVTLVMRHLAVHAVLNDKNVRIVCVERLEAEMIAAIYKRITRSTDV